MPTTIDNYIAIDNHATDWIQGTVTDKKHVLSAKLPDVRQKAVIDVRASRSANGHFYYRIVETTNGAKDLGDSTRVLQAGSGWNTIETSTLFQVTQSQPLEFVVELLKVDASGQHNIFKLTLIARIL